tara:strand:- start:1743 stop:1931 length:189 start_codon:yes stop_codon:yes gene_type:complete
MKHLENLRYVFENLDSILYDLDSVSHGDEKKSKEDMEWVRLKLLRLRQDVYEDYKNKTEQED